MEVMLEKDRQLFLWINGLSGQFYPLDYLMRGLATDYLMPVSLSLGLLGLWFASPKDKNQLGILNSMLSLGMVNLVVKLVNLVYFRPRPFSELEVNLLFYRPHDSSFPSNAAAVGFALATTVWLYNRKAGKVFFVLAFIYGLSRIYVGIHYPGDILGGIVFGVFSAYFSFILFKVFEPAFIRLLEFARRFYLA